MARVCQLTGKKPRTGNNVSHSNAKTKRRFDINLKTKKMFLPEENRWITLRVTTSALRTITKNGLAATLKKAEAKGLYSSK
jgi:large subunit ribosomal protein L28